MSRERSLELLLSVLGGTRVGVTFGLARLDGLEDFRAAVPVMDRETHEREVQQPLGFGILEPDDPRTAHLAQGDLERDAVARIRRSFCGAEAPRRIAMLRGPSGEGAVDRIARDDLDAFAALSVPRAETHVIDRAGDPSALLTKLEVFDPDVLIVPSALTCGWLEAVRRTPLDRSLRSLRLVLAEHDVGKSIRSRVTVRAAGWIGPSGRMALPTLRPPRRAMTLAMGSQIIELLAYTNPEEDGRRVYAERTILPEHAVLGMRYELVVSSALGFLRQRTGRHVRVVGFEAPSEHADVPRPRVVRLPPAPMDVKLEGCTVSGAWLTACIRQVLHREDPALVMAEIGPDPRSVSRGHAASFSGTMKLPAAFKETELAWLARTGAHRVERNNPRGLLVRVELQGFVSRVLPRQLSTRIDASLRRRSPAYAFLRDKGDILPPRVIVLPTGTRRSEEQRRIRELLGPVWVPDCRVQ
ncbi:MAG: hypothetical protein JKY37_12250 [Nannocystaceae bacterium]|nr:hypothetical protein [Nannocystaceae bacterium]